MNRYNDIYDGIFQMLKDMCESIALPTGKNAFPAFLYSAVITASTVVLTVLKAPVTFRWQGGLIATLLLGVLALEEKKGIDEVSRLYRTARARLKAAQKRATRPSPNVQAPRGTNPGDPDVVSDTGTEGPDAS